MDPGFDCVHADAELVVALKPSGLLSVPGLGPDGQDCLLARVQARFADARVVHRLDMSTSGLMLFARGAEAQRALSKAFAAREVKKRYLALVRGKMAVEKGSIELALIADWPNRPLQKVDREAGKPSLTRYEVLDYEEASDVSRVDLEPVTGRAHQLRVHLMAIGHPILGDALYAPPDVRTKSHRLMLHARMLGFRHPVTAEWQEFHSAVDFSG